MKCPICKEDVWVLNLTTKGMACILCVWKYKLKLIPSGIPKSDGKSLTCSLSTETPKCTICGKEFNWSDDFQDCERPFSATKLYSPFPSAFGNNTYLIFCSDKCYKDFVLSQLAKKDLEKQESEEMKIFKLFLKRHFSKIQNSSNKVFDLYFKSKSNPGV